jgi:hypothetical protein
VRSKKLFFIPLLFLISPALAGISLAVDEITNGSEISTLNTNLQDLETNKLDYRPGNIVPHKNSVYDLGSAAYRWRNIYVSGSTDTATSGFLGEYISTFSVSYVRNAPGTDTYFDYLSFTLTAGDWDIAATLVLDDNGSTGTSFVTAISTTSGNSSAGLNRSREFVRNIIPPTNELTTGVIPSLRVTPTATTVYYLKGFATYSAGTPQFADGFMAARRAR